MLSHLKMFYWQNLALLFSIIEIEGFFLFFFHTHAQVKSIFLLIGHALKRQWVKKYIYIFFACWRVLGFICLIQILWDSVLVSGLSIELWWLITLHLAARNKYWFIKGFSIWTAVTLREILQEREMSSGGRREMYGDAPRLKEACFFLWAQTHIISTAAIVIMMQCKRNGTSRVWCFWIFCIRVKLISSEGSFTTFDILNASPVSTRAHTHTHTNRDRVVCGPKSSDPVCVRGSGSVQSAVNAAQVIECLGWLRGGAMAS